MWYREAYDAVEPLAPDCSRCRSHTTSGLKLGDLALLGTKVSPPHLPLARQRDLCCIEGMDPTLGPCPGSVLVDGEVQEKVSRKLYSILRSRHRR